MPRTAKVDESDKAEGVVHKDLSNEFTESLCKGFVADFERESEAVRKILEAARVQCQPHLDRQKDIAKEAAECGIEKKAFKAKLRERKLERDAQGVRNTLSDRQREVFDKMTPMLENDLFSYVEENEETH